MKPDIYEGKLCCSQCHHLINLQGEPKESCPYCKKKLIKEEQEYWAGEETIQKIRDRKFYKESAEMPRQSWKFDLSKRLTRWTKQFIKEHPTKNKFEETIIKGLDITLLDGVEWGACQNMDAYECVLFILMEGSTTQFKDCQYYYARLQLSGILLCLGQTKDQKDVLKREVHGTLNELLPLIQKDLNQTKISGKVWQPTRLSSKP